MFLGVRAPPLDVDGAHSSAVLLTSDLHSEPSFLSSLSFSLCDKKLRYVNTIRKI